MNRDTLIGTVAACILVAAVSIGGATWLARSDIATLRAEQQRALGAVEAAQAQALAAASASIEATTLPRNSGVARSLVSDELLWVRGRLLVSDPASSTRQVFNVTVASGTRVETTLTVVGATRVANLDAAGRVTATGLVRGASFQNGSASFVAGASGDVLARAVTANGLGRFNAGLNVAGGIFSVGSAATSATIDTAGTVSARLVRSDRIESATNVRAAGQISAGSFRNALGSFLVSPDGSLMATAATVVGPVSAGSLTINAGTFSVQPDGNFSASGGGVIAGSLHVAGSAAFAGKLTAPNLRGGVAVVTGPATDVFVDGLPPTAGISITPQFLTTQPCWVTPFPGGFTINCTDSGTFGWTAIW